MCSCNREALPWEEEEPMDDPMMQDWLCSSCDPRSDLARMRDGEWPVDHAKADRGERIECADCGEEYREKDQTEWERWREAEMTEGQRMSGPGAKFTCE
jgi:hypothetical protein